MSSTPPPWTAVRDLFDAALPLAGAAREALLAEGAHGQAVVAEVRSLIAHHEAATAGAFEGGFLDAASTPPGSLRASDSRHAAETPPAPSAESRIGQRLGAWRITSLLGRGGMGEVWLAERTDGAFEGHAAIKVLKRGMDSEAVLARFAQEQRALARLTHPHIARLMDAGRTADGVPFFVMEHVRGRGIREACAGRPLAERLRLFLQLADAVAHAHRNLLVHRDLKPGNVMVDDQGHVKLLDFGIAKALDPVQDGTGGDELTATGERPFTPHYASPEQVRGEPVGTATDIYSLGVLLYVLLTGQRPYGRSATTPAAAARCVLEEEASRPSSLALPAEDCERTRRLLQGDLDNILLKTLEKRPEARYASVDALAGDIRAYLDGFPVGARPASWAYRARKLLARHRLASAAVATGTLAVLLALAAALWQAGRAERARETAERRFAQVRQLANDLIFRHHDKVASLPGATAAREALLADAVRFLDGLHAEGAHGDPRLAQETAEGYFRVAVLMGEQHSPSQERLRESAEHLRRALGLQPSYVDAADISDKALFNATDMWLAKANQDIRAAGLAEAVLSLRQARMLTERAAARTTGGPGEPGRGDTGPMQATSRLATVEGRLGQLVGGAAIGANLGRTTEAEPHLRRSLQLMQSLVQAQPGHAEWMHQTAWAQQNLVGWLVLTGRAEEALPHCEAMIALRDEAARLAPDNAHFGHQRGSVRASHAVALSHLGRHTEALQVQAAVLTIMQTTANGDAANRSAQRDAALSRLAAGRIRAMAGDTAVARALLESSLAALPDAAALGSAGDFYLARLRSEALLWLARAQPPSAERALALAGEAEGLMRGSDDNAARRWALAQALGEQARAMLALGRRDEALALARRALAEWQAAPGGGAPAQYRSWQSRDEALVQAQ